MISHKKFTTFLLISLLSACTSTSSFIQSKLENAASIKGTRDSENLYTWQGYKLLSVDDKFISAGAFGSPWTTKNKIDPGSRNIVVMASFNKGFGTGPFEAIIPMEVELTPGVAYRIKGTVTGTWVETWLELASTGEIVSKKYQSAFTKSAPAPAMIPIFIPLK